MSVQLQPEARALADETIKSVREIYEEYDRQGEEKYQRLRSRVSDLEAHRGRQGLGGTWHDGESHEELNKGLRLFLKHGDASGLHTKAMAVGSDPSGGYWVDAGLASSITRTIFDTSPIRQVARTVEIDADSFEEILDRNEAGASWVSETESRPETGSPEVGKSRIPVSELYAAPRITQQLMDDAKIDLAQWLTDKIGDKLSRTENTAFVSGNGVGRPRGFLSYPVVTTSDATRAWGDIQYTASGGAGAFAASNPGDKLIDMMHTLKSGYLPGAVWLMSSSTLAGVRKLKDGQGNYLWQQSVVASEPSLLLGHRVILAEDMPVIAANSLSIAFGNFARAYTIVDRVPLRMLRDPYTAKPFIIFYVYKRTGGDVTNSECIKLMKFATT